MTKHRVVITGIGLVTPLGNTTKQTWHAACQARSGIRLLDNPVLSSYPVRIAGQVPDLESVLDPVLSRKEQFRTDRFIHLAVAAAAQAVSDAKLVSLQEESGVFVGVGFGGLTSLIDAADTLRTYGMKRVSPLVIPQLTSNQAASVISIKYDMRGPTMSLNTACSSGADAIGHAVRAIQSGQCKMMIAGGAEHVLSPLAIAAFGNMRALAQWPGDPVEASRPFDAQRCGFVMAEGSGMLVLEERSHALQRGADIYAEIVGYAATNDAYHTVAIHPDGRGAHAALMQAIDEAGCMPHDIGYINAHGTSTRMNDAIEAAVIRSIFTDEQPYVSSTKSMMGHLLGAAGGS